MKKLKEINITIDDITRLIDKGISLLNKAKKFADRFKKPCVNTSTEKVVSASAFQIKINEFYKFLGVTEDAPDDVVDKAYKSKAKKLHPDTGGTAEDFAKLNSLYDKIKESRWRK